MKEVSLQIQLFTDCVVKRSRLSMVAILTCLLFLSRVGSLQAQTPVRGESIAPAAAISPNMAKPAAIVQTNFVPLLRTNAAGELLIDFGLLTSYPMQVPDKLLNNTNQPAWADAQVNAMIPASIKALNGKKVCIEGFMLPTTWDKEGKVSDFLLLANQVSCCYGGPTYVHEFITIHVKGKSLESNMESTIPVKGILHVGAVRENGQLVGIYKLETDAGFTVTASH